jgi:hypothetical protein
LIRFFTLVFVCLLFYNVSRCQKVEVDIFGGISNYQGDLQPIFLTVNLAKPAAYATLKVGITEKIYFRTGFSVGSLQGDDRVNRNYLKDRNLNFKSNLKEYNIGLEYHMLRSNNYRFTPYVFGGVGVYQFNPYTTLQGARQYLQPIGTEGQGLKEYPNLKPYDLTQICVPFGGGLFWQVNCNINLKVEFTQHKLFTDYLDDVSGSYPTHQALLAAKGQKAVDLAFRSKELNPNIPYPSGSYTGRGNPKLADWYYFGGVTVGFKLNNCETGRISLRNMFMRKDRRMLLAKLRCPWLFM